jgi:hypothetical protein
MHAHRFQESPPPDLPRLAPPAVAPGAFLVCPVAGPCPWLAGLYQWAWQQAQAVQQPSLLERSRNVIWN